MSLRDLLAELRAEYLATFADKQMNIEKLWRENRLEELETEFHKLKGTGRTYGVPEVSQLGAAMEKLCETHSPFLNDSVPLACSLLKKIDEARKAGLVLELELEGEFQAISQFLKGTF